MVFWTLNPYYLGTGSLRVRVSSCRASGSRGFDLLTLQPEAWADKRGRRASGTYTTNAGTLNPKSLNPEP